MKQKLLLKSMLLLFALIAGSSSVWASNEEISCSSSSPYFTGTNFTILYGKTSGSDPAYNSTDGGLRLYVSNYLTITPKSGETISAVTLDVKCNQGGSGGNKAYPESVTVNGGSITSGGTPGSGVTSIVWSGSTTTSLTFTVNGSKGNVAVKKITITYSASTTPKHTATFSVNGETSTQDFLEGAPIVFPEVNGVGGMKFMGWTTSEIVGTQNIVPDPLLTEAAMSTSDIPYYAVFAYHDPGKYVLDYTLDEVDKIIQAKYGDPHDVTASDGSEWVVKAYKNSGMQINTGKDCSIKIPTCVSDIKSIVITCSTAKAVGLSASDYDGSGTITYIVYGTDATSQTLDLSEESVKTGYIVPKGGSTPITKIEVIYNNTPVTKDYCTTVPTATITLNAACTDGVKIYGTYSNSSAFIVPEGLTVSEVAIFEGKLKVTKYNTGAVVPAGTGVMISADAAGEKEVALTSATGSAAGTGNRLFGTGDAAITASDMIAAAGSDNLFYRLTMHNGSTLGFWWGAADGAAFDLAAHKAYLAVPGSTSANGLTLDNDGDDTTGIDMVKGEGFKVNGEFYNLNGQRVAQPTKGLYIVNGKKVIIK